MPIFEYKAVGPDNKVKKGLIDADTPRDARLKLKRERLYVTDLNERNKEGKRRLQIRGVTGVTTVNKQRMEQIAAEHPSVLQVVHLRTLHIAPQEVLAAFKLRFARDLTMDALETVINDLEKRLRAELPHLRRIYIEPGFDETVERRARGDAH